MFLIHQYQEFSKWPTGDPVTRLGSCLTPLVLSTQTAKSGAEREALLRRWQRRGGVLLMGYELFRAMAPNSMYVYNEFTRLEVVCYRFTYYHNIILFNRVCSFDRISQPISLTSATTTNATMTSRVLISIQTLMTYPHVWIGVLDRPLHSMWLSCC